MNVVGVEKVVNVVCVEKVGGSFYSRSSLTDRAEPALQNETSSNEKYVEQLVVMGVRVYSRSSLTDRAEPAP